MRACEETGTVVCLHVGSSGTSPTTTDDAPPDTIGVLFFGYAMFAAVDWLYSQIPVRFPEHPHLPVGGWHRLGGRAARPARPRRSSYHDDVRHVDAGIELTPRRGVAAQLLVLRDRRPGRFRAAPPHRRSTTSCSSPTTRTPTPPGPTPRPCSTTRSGTCRPTTSRKITWENASRLFDFDVPASVVADPDAPWPSEQARGER